MDNIRQSTNQTNRATVLQRFKNSTAELKQYKVDSLNKFITEDLSACVNEHLNEFSLRHSPTNYATLLVNHNKEISFCKTLQKIIIKLHYQEHDSNYKNTADNPMILNEAEKVSLSFKREIESLLTDLDTGRQIDENSIFYKLQNYVCHQDTDGFHLAYRSITGNFLTKSADRIMNSLESRIQISSKEMQKFANNITSEMIEGNKDNQDALLAFGRALLSKKHDSYFPSSSLTQKLADIKQNLTVLSRDVKNTRSQLMGIEKSCITEEHLDFSQRAMDFATSYSERKASINHQYFTAEDISWLGTVCSNAINEVRANLLQSSQPDQLIESSNISIKTATEFVLENIEDFILDVILPTSREFNRSFSPVKPNEQRITPPFYSKLEEFGLRGELKQPFLTSIRENSKKVFGNLLATRSELFKAVMSCHYRRVAPQTITIQETQERFSKSDNNSIDNQFNGDNIDRSNFEHVIIKETSGRISFNQSLAIDLNHKDLPKFINDREMNTDSTFLKSALTQFLPALAAMPFSSFRAELLMAGFSDLASKVAVDYQRMCYVDLTNRTMIIQVRSMDRDNKEIGRDTIKFGFGIINEKADPSINHITEFMSVNSIEVLTDANIPQEIKDLDRKVKEEEDNTTTTTQQNRVDPDEILFTRSGIPYTNTPLKITPEPENSSLNSNKKAETTTTTTSSHTTQASVVASINTTLLTEDKRFQQEINTHLDKGAYMEAGKLAERAGQHYEQISNWEMAAKFYEQAYYHYNDTDDKKGIKLGNQAIEKFITCRIAAKLAVDVYLHDVPNYFNNFDPKTRAKLLIKISNQLVIQANEPANGANQAHYYNLAGSALADVANIYSRQLTSNPSSSAKESQGTSDDKSQIQLIMDKYHINAIRLFQEAIRRDGKAQNIEISRSKICQIFLTRMKLSDQLEEIVTGLRHIVDNRNPTDDNVLIDALKVLKDRLNSPNINLDTNMSKALENTFISLLASCSNNKEAYTLMVAKIKTLITKSQNLELGRKLSSTMGHILLDKKDFASAASFYQLSVDKTYHLLQTEENKEIREQFGRNIQYLNEKIFTLNEQARAISKL